MKDRETRVIYIARNGTKFYRQNGVYAMGIGIRSPDGSPFYLYVDGKILCAKDWFGRPPEYIPLYNSDTGVIRELRISNAGNPQLDTSTLDAASLGEYITETDGSDTYTLKVGTLNGIEVLYLDDS